MIYIEYVFKGKMTRQQAALHSNKVQLFAASRSLLPLGWSFAEWSVSQEETKIKFNCLLNPTYAEEKAVEDLVIKMCS